MRTIVCGVLMVLAVACTSKDRTSPIAFLQSTPSAPSPPLPSMTVSGLVFETTARGVAPLAGAQIDTRVDGAPWPGITTDAEGRYVIPHLRPGVFVVLNAFFRGHAFSQPTAAAATMDGDALLDIELVSTVSPLRTQRGSPSLSGRVFEATAAGTRPVRGVWVGFDWNCADNYPAADAITDAAGRYELSRLPLSKSGRACVSAEHGNRSQGMEIEFRGDTVFDFTLDASFQ